ncbi:MAG: carbon-nitrogen family hydrolase [Phycisphaerales bacterium]|nr:carbon-nitrogen family hydrolase [Phycisphaerales bacterium]
MRVHLVQHDIAWEDRAANLRRVSELLRGAPIGAGDLVILPEMFDTGFSFAVERTADGRGETAAFLSRLAAERGATVLGGTTAPGEGADGRARNRALAFGPGGGEIARFDKLHPFSIGGEAERIAPGERAAVFPWAGLTVAPAICYDLRFPEQFRAGVDIGADAFAVIANWPAARIAHWRALAIARAIENLAYVFAVNRVGRDPSLEYPGGSLAVGPRGDVLAEAGPGERVLSVEIDAAEPRRWREKFPALRDRRPIGG